DLSSEVFVALTAGRMFEVQGRHGEALEEYRRGGALALRDGPLNGGRAGAPAGIAPGRLQQGKPAQAATPARAALALHQAQLGGNHPIVATDHMNLGAMLEPQGVTSDALAEYQLALSIFERIDPQHPNVASCHFNIANALDELGRTREALAE